MTNEEAIRILKNAAVLATSTSYQAIEEAVEVATKALTSATDINVATKDGDMVYRQDAVDALDEIESEVADGFGFQYEKWRKYFTELPSASERNTGKWIPCSERLPEDEYVLVSKRPTKISGDKWSVAIAIRTADPRSRKRQWRDSGFGVIQDDKVLAWMPLPEPYGENGEAT